MSEQQALNQDIDLADKEEGSPVALQQVSCMCGTKITIPQGSPAYYCSFCDATKTIGDLDDLGFESVADAANCLNDSYLQQGSSKNGGKA